MTVPNNAPNNASDDAPSVSLKQDIINGYYMPNEKLVMSRLKGRYQIGTGPLREILAKLVQQGLVVAENQKGFRVKPITIQELLDIYESRSHLEIMCIKLAIEKGDDEWEANIIAAAHRMNLLGNLEDKDDASIKKWESIHQLFHQAILNGCGLNGLMIARQSLYEKCARYRNFWLKMNMVNPQVFADNRQEHNDLVELVINRKTDAAIELIHEHIHGPAYFIQKDIENGIFTN